VELRPDLTIDVARLRTFATSRGIRRLAAFGSVLRDDFREGSDVDLLVEFEPDRIPGLLALAAMEIELGEILGRDVELRTYHDLSRHFRDQVRSTARELYAA
jgi:predicted nucleotidyltransferase